MGRLRAKALAKRVRFIATTEEIKDELLARGVSDDRIFRIPNGLDLDVFHPPTPEAEG